MKIIATLFLTIISLSISGIIIKYFKEICNFIVRYYKKLYCKLNINYAIAQAEKENDVLKSIHLKNKKFFGKNKKRNKKRHKMSNFDKKIYEEQLISMSDNKAKYYLIRIPVTNCSYYCIRYRIHGNQYYEGVPGILKDVFENVVSSDLYIEKNGGKKEITKVDINKLGELFENIKYDNETANELKKNFNMQFH